MQGKAKIRQVHSCDRFYAFVICIGFEQAVLMRCIKIQFQYMTTKVLIKTVAVILFATYTQKHLYMY